MSLDILRELVPGRLELVPGRLMSADEEIKAIDRLIDWLKAKLKVRPACESRLQALGGSCWRSSTTCVPTVSTSVTAPVR